MTTKLLPTIKQKLRAACLIAIAFCMVVTNITYAADDDRLINLGLPYLSYSSSLCSSSGGASSLDGFLQALALHESSGNPTAANPGSSASGKYQYISSTWQARSDIYGPANQYATAAAAPEAVQDAVAYIEYAQKFEKYDGDVEKLAMSHFQPAVADNPERWGELAPGNNNGMTYQDYVDTFTAKIGTPEAKAIKLLYAQAPDFQTWLTKSGANVSGASASSSGCGVAAGDFVLYLQFDSKWGGNPYAGSTISASGCGPSSLAMVVATLKDKSVTPAETAEWSQDNGHTYDGGSAWSLFSEGPANWGLKSQTLFTSNDNDFDPSRPTSSDVDAAVQVLRTGGLVIASGTGPIPFTTSGHIIVIRGVDESGKLLVGDPGHNRDYGPDIPNPNETAYEPSELMPYIRGLWGVTK